MTVLFVAAGGALGVLARYGLGTSVPAASLPWMTLGINVAGSFALGLLLTLGQPLAPEVRHGLAVGFLGGFTTFSTFSVDVVRDLEAGNGGKAAVYLLASVGLGVAAAAAGLLAGRALAE